MQGVDEHESLWNPEDQIKEWSMFGEKLHAVDQRKKSWSRNEKLLGHFVGSLAISILCCLGSLGRIQFVWTFILAHALQRQSFFSTHNPLHLMRVAQVALCSFILRLLISEAGQNLERTFQFFLLALSFAGLGHEVFRTNTMPYVLLSVCSLCSQSALLFAGDLDFVIFVSLIMSACVYASSLKVIPKRSCGVCKIAIQDEERYFNCSECRLGMCTTCRKAHTSDHVVRAFDNIGINIEAHNQVQNHGKATFSSGANWHRQRMKGILTDHPEVRDLFGIDQMTLFYVALFSSLAIVFPIVTRNLSLPVLFILTFVIGTPIQYILSRCLAHDCGHFLASESPHVNKFAVALTYASLNFAGTVSYLDAAVQHRQHHVALRSDLDLDQPNALQYEFYGSTGVYKIYFLITLLLQGMEQNNPVDKVVQELIMLSTLIRLKAGRFYLIEALSGNILWLTLSAVYGPRIILWQLMVESFRFLHPLYWWHTAMHYQHGQGAQPTASIYSGFFNLLLFNLGYHCEHHDFFNIPWSRLPHLRILAPEYYETIDTYTFFGFIKICLLSSLPKSKFLFKEENTK